MVARVFIVVMALLAWLAPLSAGRQPGPVRDALILITLDGVRAAEMFGGLDADILRSTLAKDARLEDSAAFKRFNAATAVERREKVMPFFWKSCTLVLLTVTVELPVLLWAKMPRPAWHPSRPAPRRKFLTTLLVTVPEAFR